MINWNIHNIILIVVFGNNTNVIRKNGQKLYLMIEYYEIKMISSNSFITWKMKTSTR